MPRFSAASTSSNKPAVLLGMNAMKAFDKVSIDFARKQLRMVVPAETSIESAR